MKISLLDLRTFCYLLVSSFEVYPIPTITNQFLLYGIVHDYILLVMYEMCLYIMYIFLIKQKKYIMYLYFFSVLLLNLIEDFCICFNIYGFLFLQVYGGKGEQKHRQIQFGGSAQQVIHSFWI